jgi:hypothetical protein
MKIIAAIKWGLTRSLRAWKGIVILWFISLAMVSMIVVPLKASLNSAFGSSMVTEKLIKGINFDVLGDLGKNLHSFGSSLFAGLILLSLLTILVNVFITGGLFDSLKQGTGKVTSENFFSSSAKNFKSFLLVSLILYLLVIFLMILIIVIPVAIAGNSESAPEGVVFLTFAITFPLFMAVAAIIYLVADYARAYQVASSQALPFKAIAFGFSQTFSTFTSSYPLVVIMLFFQILPGWAMIKLTADYTPSTRGGLVLLFAASQLLFLLRIFFKVLRYGSITSLMDLNRVSVSPATEIKMKSDPDDFVDFTNKFNPETNV